MGHKIELELDVHEALIVLGRISDAALSASRLAATSTGDEHEIADVTSKVLARVQVRLTDALYPVCRFPREDDICGREFAGNFNGSPRCKFHLALELGEYDQGYPEDTINREGLPQFNGAFR